MRNILFLFLAFATSVASAEGLPGKEVKRLFEQSYYVTPEDCAERDICDIKEVGFRLSRFMFETKKSHTTEVEYGTVLYATVETKTHDTLEKYVFVQWVRGCVIEINQYGGVATKHFLTNLRRGEKVPMCFPDWVIDREAEDPAYSSDTSTPSRHHFAQWVDVPETSLYTFPNAKNIATYGEKKPTIPKIGIVDTHQNAYVLKWKNGRVMARSVYLEFRTCLYKEADVPRTFDEKKDTLPPAIACYEWKSDFGYDEATQKIIRSGTLDMCLEKGVFPSIEALQRSKLPGEKRSIGLPPQSPSAPLLEPTSTMPIAADEPKR